MNNKEKLQKVVEILEELWLDVPMKCDSMLDAYTTSIERLARARAEVDVALNLLNQLEDDAKG